MIGWLIKLWEAAFIKTVHLDRYKVMVSIDFGAYMTFWSVILIVVGIALGTFGTMIVLKFLGKTK